MIDTIEVCYGCSACALICPQNAIEIKRDPDGFIKPQLNRQKCVECSLCRKVCPSLQRTLLALKNSSCQVGKYTGLTEHSSSGAIAYAISKAAINRGEAVCGVVYDADMMSVRHETVFDLYGLNRVSGSKYLQSNPYTGLKDLLTKRRGILFGTPCQIAGFRNVIYHRRLEDTFLLVDIFCHGVPSQLLWTNHLKYLHEKHGISIHDKVDFRFNGGFTLKVGKYKGAAQVDPFYHLYLNRCTYAESCYQCPFRRHSAADIRLGDYFIEKGNPQSVVFSLTEAGKACMEQMVEQEDVKLCTAAYADVDQAQDADVKSEPPRERRKYLEQLRAGQSPANLMGGGGKIFLQYVKGFIKKLIRRE